MTVPEVRDALRAPAIPRPRSAEIRTAERAPAAPPQLPVEPLPAPALPAARYPWPEPWGSFRGAVPRTEFWDVETASWLSRGPQRRSSTGD
jgi:hypothetical protein